MSVLERCPSYRESNKGSKERQGPTLGVRFTKVFVLERCPSYRESNKGSKERQGPTLGVRFTKVSVFERCPSLFESQIKGVKKGRDQL